MLLNKICLVLMVWLPFANLNAQNNISLRDEKYRPQFHFHPERGWIGDPDGLISFKGEYHLFWWGHAKSSDLVHWEELPYPMKGGDGSFSYFSGSVVVDENNDSGFGNNSMLAFYTRHMPGDSLPETQAISISTDGGIEFHYYDRNPVLDINKIFFRDPQVFWHDESKKWKMVVSLPDEQLIHIYESEDLKRWKYCSAFGGLGAKNSFWECPDLFQLPVLESTGAKKWVMLIGRGPNRVQYFVGGFDGKTFIPDQEIVNYLQNGEGLDGEIYEDFEKGISSNWKIDREVLLDKEASGDISDYLGKKYIGSLSKKKVVGSMRSNRFKIHKSAVNFLIAGNQNVDSLSISLIVDGKIARTATGDNTKVFRWNGWDVSDLKGKMAHVEIVDKTSNGAIAIDHIMFSDVLMNQQLEHALWLDYGNDYYATRVWRNYGDNVIGDTVFAIGWMGNWEYARMTPSWGGRGFQSLPRTMSLKQHNSSYRIVQQPVPQLRKLRGALHHTKNLKIEGIQKLEVFQPKKNTYELEVDFTLLSNATFGLNLMVGEGRKLVLIYDPSTSIICLDRTNATDYVLNTGFINAFARKMYAPVKLQINKLRLHIFIDQSSIEVFTNDGEVVLSATTYPSEKQIGLEVFSEGGATKISSLNAWELSSIW